MVEVILLILLLFALLQTVKVTVYLLKLASAFLYDAALILQKALYRLEMRQKIRRIK